QNWPHPPMPP
uniref:Bradykinin-potentiating peptide 10d n=2 Tax=Bothrops TaxID=8721 RepID=BPPAD_BOTCO|nr:RecName: Full=Bradykinin-potentiating peptide 10d; Short=BPP-10d [Bothrops cotiara]P0DJK5.1 RecName: Full=Bradykinin-potentiating peptide 10d; Short=BPP-10d [Bothrops fonsecai]